MKLNPIGFWTLFKKETHRYLVVWGQTLVSPLLSNMLFLAVFGGVFSSRSAGAGGDEYLPFLVPGLCIMGAINAAYQNPTSSLMIQKYQGIAKDLNTYPISDIEKTLAHLMSGTIRGLIVGLLTWASTLPFVWIDIAHPVWFVLSLAGVSLLFAACGLIIGLKYDSFDSISFWQMIVLTPLTYLGGVFFKVSTLPGILSDIAIWNPIFPLIDTVRWSFLGTSEGNINIGVPYMLLLIVVACFFAYRMVKSGKGLRT